MSIIQGKLAQRYAGRNVDALKAVAAAHEHRSLAEFEVALQEYKSGLFSPSIFAMEKNGTDSNHLCTRPELSDDPIIRNHLAALYDTLLEQNLMRIIEPYSRVEIGYVAETVKQPVKDVEAKSVFSFSVTRLLHTLPLIDTPVPLFVGLVK
jgi:26S proteasome regulatory subunit N6